MYFLHQQKYKTYYLIIRRWSWFVTISAIVTSVMVTIMQTVMASITDRGQVFVEIFVFNPGQSEFLNYVYMNFLAVGKCEKQYVQTIFAIYILSFIDGIVCNQ